MEGGVPSLSVVVPTFNRSDLLCDVLDALGRQELIVESGDPITFEVIVVSDGSTDETATVVREAQTVFPIRFIEQENAGPAAARNAGIEASRGRTIVFLDDDVVPAPEFLQAHARLHHDRDDVIGIGPMLTPDVELRPWVEWEQHQLEKQYERFAGGGTAWARQFYTGNASVQRQALRAAGGFQTALRRSEDVELAYRLAEQGVEFVFVPEAAAYHFADRSLDAWCATAEAYGRNVIVFARTGLLDELRLSAESFASRSMAERVFFRTAVAWPAVDRLLVGLLRRAVATRHRVVPKRVERGALSVLYGLLHFRGIAAELGSSAAFRRMMSGSLLPARNRFVFLLEQTLGHVTHAQNLATMLADHPSAECRLEPISMVGSSRIPGASNWTVAAGRSARRALAGLPRIGRKVAVDGVFVHTQVPAVLLGRWMRRVPVVVSLDATPLQYDELGEHYRHTRAPAPVEWMKLMLNRRCFHRAAHLVTWSEWTKRSLVSEYGVSGNRVTVIAPGVDLAEWEVPDRDDRDREPVRILFVGRDMARKGGDLLLEAARGLRDTGVDDFEIHLVTSADVAPEPGVVVHDGLMPNTTELREQYRLADIFCLPTLGDCLPMVLAEAGASGLPLIATDVGAVSEIVRTGETGCLIAPHDVEALRAALQRLIGDPEYRRELGRQARALVERDHDARANANRIVGILQEHAITASLGRSPGSGEGA